VTWPQRTSFAVPVPDGTFCTQASASDIVEA
jgi:hypothetical protein